MILDTRRQTVSFDGPVTLTVQALERLLETLNAASEFDTVLGGPEDGRLDLAVRGIYHVESDNDSHLYTVVFFEDGSWACSCLDWIYRRSTNDEWCKHIRRLRWTYGVV